MLPPACRQVGLQVGRCAQGRMHVGVDDLEAGLGLSCRLGGAVGVAFGGEGSIKVHGDLPRRENVAKALSIRILCLSPAAMPGGSSSSPSNCQCGKSVANSSIWSD